jgi:hypothetical protein
MVIGFDVRTAQTSVFFGNGVIKKQKKGLWSEMNRD